MGMIVGIEFCVWFEAVIVDSVCNGSLLRLISFSCSETENGLIEFSAQFVADGFQSSSWCWK